MKRILVISVMALGVSIPAAAADAAPRPNENATTNPGQGCDAVLTHNPNTTASARMSQHGAENFSAVGEAFCF